MNMEITTACQVKASFNDDLRRFSVLRDASFKQLMENVVQIFNIDPRSQVVLKYADNEGEHITMSSDAELKEAIAISPTMLRIVVSLKTNPTVPSAPVISSGGIEDVPMGNATAPEHPVSFYPRWGQRHPYGFTNPGTPDAGAYLYPQLHPAPFHAQVPHHGGHRGHHGHRGHYHHGPYAAGMPQHFGEPHHHHKGDRDEQMRMWKEQKREWKKQWQSMNKEDREHLKEQKKELKKQWKAQKMATCEQTRGIKGKMVARHVKDVTIADGTELPAGAPFVKTWRIRNDGEEWPAGCRLIWISRNGDRMGAPESVSLAEGPIVPQQEVDVSVDLVAPTEPGRYTCYFRLATAEGVKFGQRMWASIVVPGSSSSSDEEAARMVKYGNVAEMIEAMGFCLKRKHIVRLLAKHNGDVDKVVRVLTKMDKGCEKKKERKDKKY